MKWKGQMSTIATCKPSLLAYVFVGTWVQSKTFNTSNNINLGSLYILVNFQGVGQQEPGPVQATHHKTDQENKGSWEKSQFKKASQRTIPAQWSKRLTSLFSKKDVNMLLNITTCQFLPIMPENLYRSSLSYSANLWINVTVPHASNPSPASWFPTNTSS